MDIDAEVYAALRGTGMFEDMLLPVDEVRARCWLGRDHDHDVCVSRLACCRRG